MMLLALSAALALQAAPAPDPEAYLQGGTWRMEEQIAALDGRRTVTSTLLSTNKVRDNFGQEVPALIMLKCQARSLTVFISWPGAYFGTHLNEVSWRVGDAPIHREFWEAPYGVQHATAKGNPRQLLDAMAGGGQLVMRVSSYNTTQDIIFDLGHSAAAVGTVREACARR